MIRDKIIALENIKDQNPIAQMLLSIQLILSQDRLKLTKREIPGPRTRTSLIILQKEQIMIKKESLSSKERRIMKAMNLVVKLTHLKIFTKKKVINDYIKIG